MPPWFPYVLFCFLILPYTNCWVNYDGVYFLYLLDLRNILLYFFRFIFLNIIYLSVKQKNIGLRFNPNSSTTKCVLQFTFGRAKSDFKDVKLSLVCFFS
jgi:hypothetical protein